MFYRTTTKHITSTLLVRVKLSMCEPWLTNPTIPTDLAVVRDDHKTTIPHAERAGNMGE